MTKPSKSSLNRVARAPQRGKKTGEVQTSVAALAARHSLTHEEAKEELEGLRAAGLCDFKRMPENPHTKFKIETFARAEPLPRAEAPPSSSSSSFVRRVEAKYGEK